jgi:hypothetical protein
MLKNSTSTTPNRVLIWIDIFEVFLVSFKHPSFGLCFLSFFLDYNPDEVCLVANDNFRCLNEYVKNNSVPNKFIKIYKVL